MPALPQPRQKLVTFFLSMGRSAHGKVEEHLANYLELGWRIVSVTPASGGLDGCLLAVVLEH